MSHIKTIAQGHRKKHKNVCSQGESYGHATTISMLPDDILLEMFDFYNENHQHRLDDWKWHLLVHVCRRWRQVVFASPLRLNLRIVCTAKAPVSKNLDIWPALPIIIDFGFNSDRQHGNNTSIEDNIITALEHVDRVSDVRLRATGSELEKISTLMKATFPMLTSLHIWSSDLNAPILPAEFLGGSAPCLQFIDLHRIPFPTLPTLLLSTTDLVTLDLGNIPPTGYIPPEAMVVGLAALPKLSHLTIDFQSASPRPDLIHPPPVTRTALPALTRFDFRGASEYLENLVARIDSPQLDQINIRYFNQLVDFQVDQLAKFINRSVGPKLTLIKNASVTFDYDRVAFNVPRHADDLNPNAPSAMTSILCEGIDWQVSHMAKVLSQLSVTLSNVVHLKFEEEDCQLEGTEDVEWLHLLHQFSTVQMLHVSQELAGQVALALEDITAEMVSDALPSLDSIYLEGQPASGIEKFVATRLYSDRPITVLDTKWEFDERVKSYVGR